MSDRERSYSPPPINSSKIKRKSTSTSNATKTKRARTQIMDPFASAKEIVQNALASPNSFAVPEGKDGLEGSVAVAGSSGQTGPPPKTAYQIECQAARIAEMVNKGIKKQMSWKPNCKEGRATYAFDGVCSDPRVVGAMLKLDGPPTFTRKKNTVDEFEEMVGRVSGSVRYATLRLASDINLQWNSHTGQFKLSGKYGK